MPVEKNAPEICQPRRGCYLYLLQKSRFVYGQDACVRCTAPPLPGFEEIYAKYKSYFVRIAMSYVWDRMAAEDIVTDSFVVFWTNRHDLDQRNIPAYIYTVIVRKCRNWLRDRVQHQRAHDTLQQTELRILEDS